MTVDLDDTAQKIKGKENFGDVPYDKLFLVRVQRDFNDSKAEYNSQGVPLLVMNRAASGRAEEMNTFHYTLNGTVTEHALGTGWNNMEAVVIAPLVSTVHETNSIPSGINPADTYFHADPEGNMRLATPYILVPEDAPVPDALRAFTGTYKRGATGEETNANRERAVNTYLKSQDAPVRPVGMHGWISPDDTPENRSALAAHLAPGKEVTIGLHSNGPDGLGWDRTRIHVDMFLEGIRTHEDFSGMDTPLLEHIATGISDFEAHIHDRIAKGADPNAIHFKLGTLDKIANRFQQQVLPIAENEFKAKMADNYFYTVGDKISHEPIERDAFFDLAKSGKLPATTLIWHNQLDNPSKWEEFRFEGESQAKTLRWERPKILERRNEFKIKPPQFGSQRPDVPNIPAETVPMPTQLTRSRDYSTLKNATQHHAGIAVGVAGAAVNLAQGNVGAAAADIATSSTGVNTISKGMSLAADAKKALPIVKLFGKAGVALLKRAPLIGAVVTAAAVTLSVAGDVAHGEYKKAAAEGVAGGAEILGNTVGFGVGDAAREAVRGGFLKIGGKEYEAEKSGLRELGGKAVELATAPKRNTQSMMTRSAPAP